MDEEKLEKVEQMSDSDNDSDDSDTDAAKIHQKLVLRGMSKLLRKKKRKVNPFTLLLSGLKKKKPSEVSDQTELQELNESESAIDKDKEKEGEAVEISAGVSAGSGSHSDDEDSLDHDQSKRNT